MSQVSYIRTIRRTPIFLPNLGGKCESYSLKNMVFPTGTLNYNLLQSPRPLGPMTCTADDQYVIIESSDLKIFSHGLNSSSLINWFPSIAKKQISRKPEKNPIYVLSKILTPAQLINPGQGSANYSPNPAYICIFVNAWKISQKKNGVSWILWNFSVHK